MTHNLQVFQTVLAFAAVVLLCVVLKWRGLIREDHGPLFARLLTEVALPVLIFAKLAVHPLGLRQFLPALAMIGAVIVCLGVSWAAGALLRLDRPRIGALMIASSFGSSTLIGYPLVQHVFPGNAAAMADAILISELGVGLAIFTLCVWVAMYFGAGGANGSKPRHFMGDYLRSPIFIALAGGLVISPWGLNPQTPWLAPFFQAADMVGEAVALLACLILALELDWRSLAGLWPLVLVSGAIQLGLHPWVADVQAKFYHFNLLPKEVLVLEAAMPSAILGVVFATRYRCAPEVNAALVFTNILLSVITVPLAFWLLCG